ncbi:hypothetical protein KSC_104480 [Ktedonobacter sp. SOSP1-52]|uniref:hypothetical protein n=1 Tax=Ktedonobacter sp. SOSP1-52 TaxID=2778366 RepID=UPI0019160460|nr:hypothetical protein [Ktedonobacter sp. SOSP1-52]GHO71556.1 hypothetical protein KSC_104480 [Ktedonobacter sp. SOSP1-52]
MSPHDTALGEANQTSARKYSAIISQTSDVLLQACGLGPEACVDRLHTTLIRGRGRPQQVSWIHLWSSLLLCALQGMHSFADWRRLVGLQRIGPFAPVWLTRNGMVKRLLQAGLDPLQDLWEMINMRLAHIGSWAVAADVAAFASGIFASSVSLPFITQQ